MTELVDAKAEADFEALEAFLEVVKQRSRTRGTTTSGRETKENQLLDELIDLYGEGASLYFHGAKRVIQERWMDPIHRSQNYHKILGPLVEHSRIIADFVRAFMDKDNKRPKSILLLEKMIATIATRLGEARFLTFTSPNFQYIHLYYSGVEVIGVPPPVVGAPSWNLAVLWHEIAGHEIALARRKGVLDRWARELSYFLKQQGVLGAYNTLYDQVNLNLPNGVQYNSVDLDELQADWVSEFFEDLFGVQAVGGAMVEVLAVILVQRYEDLNRGDPGHPPAMLRLLVAMALLSDSEQQDTANRLIAYYDDREFFRQADHLWDLAKAIATFYQHKVDQREFSKPTQEISDKEKKVATIFSQKVNEIFDLALGPGFNALGLGQARDGLTQALTTELEGFEPDGLLPADKSNALWTTAPNRQGEEVAIFFLKDVNEAVRETIEGLIPRLEQAILAHPDGGSILIETGDNTITVFFPSSVKRIATIVVRDTAGRELYVNDFDSLFDVRFAEADDCCPWIGGG